MYLEREENYMKKIISTRLPEMTIEQIEMLKRFYELDDLTQTKFSTSRIIIICINNFWKKIFEEATDTYLDDVADQVMKEYGKR